MKKKTRENVRKKYIPPQTSLLNDQLSASLDCYDGSSAGICHNGGSASSCYPGAPAGG